MTTPLGGQSADPAAGQSAGGADPGAANAGAAGGQGAPGATGTTPADGGQSTVSREDYDRLRAQLQAADQKRTEAERAHAQLRDKDVPALQKAERDLVEAQAALTERDTVISSLRVENSFLTANSHDWHNPGAAMQLLDRSKITVDADGRVTGMKDALEALAKAHPYLLKPKPADAGGAGGAGPVTPPPPGTAPANGGIAPGAGTKPSNEDLVRRFPAMKQRLS